MVLLARMDREFVSVLVVTMFASPIGDAATRARDILADPVIGDSG